MITLYGEQLICPICKSEDLNIAGVDKIDRDIFAALNCKDCKHIWTISWNNNQKVAEYEAKNRS